MTAKNPSDICSVEGCGKPFKANGLCNAHNERRRLGKEVTARPVRTYQRGDGPCKVEGCERLRRHSVDYCGRHYQRARRHNGEVGGAELQRSPANQAIWHTPEYKRRFRRLANYGLTPEEFDLILAGQNSRCAVCGTKDPYTNRVGAWCVDHDHVTGQVRGLLCATCNRGIGMLKDDPDMLAKASEYIRKHRQMILFGPAGPKGYAG